MSEGWPHGTVSKVVRRFAAASAICCVGAAACPSRVEAQGASGLPPAPLPAASTSGTGANLRDNRIQAETGSTDQVLQLGIDEAIARGLKYNLQIELSRQNQRSVHGQVLTVGNNLLPLLTASARSETQEINLAAMGFKPSSLASLGLTGHFSEIVKVDTTAAQVNLSQQLFNVPAYYLFRAAQKADQAAGFTTLLARGNVALAVGTEYLQVLADAAQIENAQALEKADETQLQQATALKQAGVGINIDVLRAQVQLQTQQQVLINDRNTWAKDQIALNRQIGLPANQPLQLTDTVPFAEFTELPLEDALKLAAIHRKDLLGLQAQLQVAQQARKAVKFERLPTLAASGFYGVLGETQGLYHGVFTAQGSLSVPILYEGQLRGEREVAEAQVTALHQQIASLNLSIEQQIRDSMLDVQSTSDRVKVARSNVDLAALELQDAVDRFSAGVSDNLPVVQAQATLASAQATLVNTTFQYNQAKLTLARNTGVIETQYKSYLGR